MGIGTDGGNRRGEPVSSLKLRIPKPSMATNRSRARPSESAVCVRHELRRRWRAVALTAGLMLAGAAVGVVPALMAGGLIDHALPGRNLGLAAALAGGMAGAALVQLSLASIETYMRASIGEAVSRCLRELAFDRVAAARYAELERFPSEQLVFRLTRSCGRIGDWYVAGSLLPAASHALVLAATATAMLLVAWQLGLLAIVRDPGVRAGRRCPWASVHSASTGCYWATSNEARFSCKKSLPDCGWSACSTPRPANSGAGGNG